tara:strand:- start:1212 stop:1634 length:423 start_codon:yes stop_codon:yes gene_type:complete
MLTVAGPPVPVNSSRPFEPEMLRVVTAEFVTFRPGVEPPAARTVIVVAAPVMKTEPFGQLMTTVVAAIPIDDALVPIEPVKPSVTRSPAIAAAGGVPVTVSLVDAKSAVSDAVGADPVDQFAPVSQAFPLPVPSHLTFAI